MISLRKETIVVDDPTEVEAAVAKMGLNYTNLMDARNEVFTQLSDQSPLEALSASGQRAYLSGVYVLRKGHIPYGWVVNRQDNVETIINSDKTLKVGYQTVNRACVKALSPQPRSRKGAASERQCQPNLFDHNDVSLPSFVKTTPQRTAFYYLMVDETGAAELSRPIVKNGLYVGFVERIFLGKSEEEPDLTYDIGAIIEEPLDGFEVAISSRKIGNVQR